jgi:hypothetical protein
VGMLDPQKDGAVLALALVRRVLVPGFGWISPQGQRYPSRSWLVQCPS